MYSNKAMYAAACEDGDALVVRREQDARLSAPLLGSEERNSKL